ncbi:MAG: PilZ domain-containing protein [Myxococcota bacterium]
MPQEPLVQRTIVYHASREALGPMTDIILARLGYHLVLPEAFERAAAEGAPTSVDMLLLDERRLDELDALQARPGLGTAPIVLLTGARGASEVPSRVVGAVKRPAGLHDLYRLMQQVFEDKPRSTPRVATQLRARCHRAGREWDGRVLSLSENGCLMRSPEAIPLGQRFQLDLALPRVGAVSLEAEATYQLLPDTGLVFNAVAPQQRETLERFVTQTILTV